MPDLKHARAMLQMADKDLQALKGMSDQSIFAVEIFGFHAQQAIEKSLKSWIALLGQEYPLTHNLIALLELLESHHCDVQRFWKLVKYNSFAIQFRYQDLLFPGPAV